MVHLQRGCVYFVLKTRARGTIEHTPALCGVPHNSKGMLTVLTRKFGAKQRRPVGYMSEIAVKRWGTSSPRTA